MTPPPHRLPDGCKQPAKAGPPAPGGILRKLDHASEDGGGLGWGARLLHEAVAEHSNAKLREWIKNPQVYHLDKTFDPYSIMMGSSPRFNRYGNEFGLGKAVALRSGYAHKFDGKVSAYPGREGGGSVDLKICLPPATMAVLEADMEFTAAVTVS